MDSNFFWSFKLNKEKKDIIMYLNQIKKKKVKNLNKFLFGFA